MNVRVLHSVATTQIILSLVGLVFGALFWVPAASFYKRSHVTTGTVVAMKAGEYDSAAPVFTFKEGDGVELRKESEFYSSPAEFSVGQKISIRFLPGDPDSARPDTFWNIWVWPIIIQGASLLVLVFSLVGRAVLRRFAPSSARAV
jgi:hypothetical protein